MASDITILAGKNESGKTAILEALCEFNNTTVAFPEESYPINTQEKPEVSITYQIETKPLLKLLKHLDSNPEQDALDYLTQYGITVTKNSNGEYYLTNELEKRLNNIAIAKKHFTYR